MASKLLIHLTIILLAFIFLSSVVNEIFWSNKENNDVALRTVIGLPSVGVGNLSPASRNPGVEALCTGLYDVPGGFCSYFSPGVPFISFQVATNITLNSNFTKGGK